MAGLRGVHLETRGVDKEGGREDERGGSKPAERKVNWRQGDLPRGSRSRPRTACSRQATPRLSGATPSIEKSAAARLCRFRLDVDGTAILYL